MSLYFLYGSKNLARGKQKIQNDMQKTLIIFDIDGTLLHSNRVDSQCFATAYESVFGLPFPTIDWTQYPHVTDTTIFDTVIREHFGRPASEEDVNKQLDHFVGLLHEKRREAPEHFQEVPEARQTVEKLLADDRFTVGIATGGWERPARLKLAHIGIPTEKLTMSFADGKITREAIIEEVLNRVGGTPRTVYVGDAIWDVTTTRRMNLNFIGIRRGGDMEFLYDHGAQHVLQDYADYDAFLEAVALAQPPH